MPFCSPLLSLCCFIGWAAHSSCKLQIFDTIFLLQNRDMVDWLSKSITSHKLMSINLPHNCFIDTWFCISSEMWFAKEKYLNWKCDFSLSESSSSSSSICTFSCMNCLLALLIFFSISSRLFLLVMKDTEESSASLLNDPFCGIWSILWQQRSPLSLRSLHHPYLPSFNCPIHSPLQMPFLCLLLLVAAFSLPICWVVWSHCFRWMGIWKLCDDCLK